MPGDDRVIAALLLLLAADPPAPQATLTLGTRIHLHASEELDPDLLRPLARKNVTLWLSTRSNTLRGSTLDTINRFGEAWLAFRAPVLEAEAHQLAKVPTAGLWIDASDLDGARRLLGPRRLAVKLSGPLDPALAEKLRKLRISELSWAAPAEVDLLSWGLFRQLPGRKVLRRKADELWPLKCPPSPSASEPTMEVAIEALATGAGRAFPCGRAPRVLVPLTVEVSTVQALLALEPSAELVLEVGEDPLKASKARRLLDALGFK